ncbi:DoxX family protein [Microbispora bryophytorum]|uniref:DoxX family membrane protein n=1 Tax=Microbispora bryophytorum subsp. camponoti TaxID=1677852 RepID=A0ABR8L4D4_9ACTN|nr:DoxX family membrane protein [Microbispora camponoti]MBD3143581.1 DoxX family membrane protein [Microbispora camponoti]
MKRTLHDLASLAARMGVGGIFFANGWQKLEAGLNATADQFTALQAPLPHVWAPVTMLTELVGGALLIAGLAVPVIGLLLFAEALAVFVVTAGDSGLPLTGGDIELIVALGAASVLLAVTGAGRISVDHMVVIKRREAEAAGEFAAEAEADAVIAALRPPRPGEPGAGESPARPAPPGPPSGERQSRPTPSTGSPGSPGALGTPGAPGSPGSPGAPESPESPEPRPAGGGNAGPTATGTAADRPGEEASATTAVRKATPRQRRTRREDDTTTESRAEAPPAR